MQQLDSDLGRLQGDFNANTEESEKLKNIAARGFPFPLHLFAKQQM